MGKCLKVRNLSTTCMAELAGVFQPPLALTMAAAALPKSSAPDVFGTGAGFCKVHEKVKLGLNSPGKSISKVFCQACIEQGKPASTVLQHLCIIRLEIQCFVTFQNRELKQLAAACSTAFVMSKCLEQRTTSTGLCSLGFQFRCTGSIFSDHGFCVGGQPA